MFKRKKNEKGEELENAYDVFMRNYKTVPGFKPLVKLLGYFIFIGILLVLASNITTTTTTKANTDKTTTTTTTVAVPKVTYGDILNKVVEDGRSYSITVKQGDLTYVIDESIKAGVLTGYLDSAEGIKKFKIEKNVIKEILLEQETVNNELFTTLEKDFIIIPNLINVLKSNKSIKEFEDIFTIYTYTINKNNVEYKIKTYISNEKCNKITINSNTQEYLIVIQ